LRLQFAARALCRNPRFTGAALIMLVLGVGSVSALFSVVNKVLLEPLPYPDPDRLVQLITTSQVGEQRLVSIPQFMFWRDTTHSFESIAASDVDGPQVHLMENVYRRALKTARVSAEYFRSFGAKLANGRGFSAYEDSPEGPKVVVMTNGLWRRDFQSDSGIIGRAILLDDVWYTVVGVLAPDVRLEPSADIWLPLCADPRSVDHIARVRVIARLRTEIGLKDAQQEVARSLQPFLKRYPPDSQFGAPRLFAEEFTAIPLRDAVVGDVRPALRILMGAVCFVLAISCANAAAVLLARAGCRVREVAVMMTMGAEPRQIRLQLLAEGVLLSLAGAIGSLIVGRLGVRAILAISPADLPRLGANGSAIALDWKVFLFTLSVSIVIGILCALAPAVNASRTDISMLVKDGASESGMTFRRNRCDSHDCRDDALTGIARRRRTPDQNLCRQAGDQPWI
jgi:predicted permease